MSLHTFIAQDEGFKERVDAEEGKFFCVKYGRYFHESMAICVAFENGCYLKTMLALKLTEITENCITIDRDIHKANVR